MKIIDAVALISINETLIVQLVSFLIFLFILKRIMIRPLNQSMQNRQDHLARISEDIQAKETAYQNIYKEIREQEETAKATAFKMRDEMEASGKQSAADLIMQTRNEIQQLRNSAQKDVSDKIAAASKQIQAEAGAIADKMIASLLGGTNS